LTALPIYFRTDTTIAGVIATDLHTLNTVLGATIEEQVVRTLNLLRRSWDPSGEYALYTFVRQPQSFPDVRLRKVGGDDTPLIGIELKGWYLLAKEGEPSLRYTVTAAATTPQDLLVVVPWALGNVISGSPTLYEPFVVPARFAAEYRNHHWQHVRKAKGATGIRPPTSASPYPSKSDRINDEPESDSGGNFGRLARTGLLNSYMDKLNVQTLCGVKADHWRQFLKAFQESSSDEQVADAHAQLRRRVQAELPASSPKAEAVLRILADLERLIGPAE
jgi:hypothetical protein